MVMANKVIHGIVQYFADCGYAYHGIINDGEAARVWSGGGGAFELIIVGGILYVKHESISNGSDTKQFELTNPGLFKELHLYISLAKSYERCF